MCEDEELYEVEDEPDGEDDAFITDSRDGYAVSFAGRYIDTYPRYDMAMYELAALMNKEGYFPDAWHVNDHGNYDNIGAELAAYEDQGGNLKALEGAQYEPGTLLIVREPLSDWPTWVVIRDYGTEGGLYMHTRGDPTVTMVAEGNDRESILAMPEDEEE